MFREYFCCSFFTPEQSGRCSRRRSATALLGQVLGNNVAVMKRIAQAHALRTERGGAEGAVSVRSAEGEEVAWSRSAAARSAALANWVSDTGGPEGAFETLVPADALRTLSRVAEGGAEDGGVLQGCSLAQLAQLLHGAHFLDVDLELLRLLSRTLCTGHLAGKSGPELGRLLGVVSDFPTEAERREAT